MRVKELIEQLEAAPENAEVKIFADGKRRDIVDINLVKKPDFDEYGYSQKGKEVVIDIYE